MSRIFAYGFRRTTADLAPLDAGQLVYVDHDTERRARRDLLKDVQPGDVVRVLYMRDLGGSPAADRVWRERIEDAGAAVEEHRPPTPPKPMKRPSKLPPSGPIRDRVRTAWLDPTETLDARLQHVADILGGPVSRQSLYSAFGRPGAAKEQSEKSDR